MHAMGTSNTAVLPGRFETHLDVRDERIKEFRYVSATQMKAQLPPGPQPAGLLTVPVEIRLQFYRYCLPRRRVVAINNPWFLTSFPLMEEAGERAALESYE